MSRPTIFVKGNLDVRDSLHALRLGKVVWNGVNEVLRQRARALIQIAHPQFRETLERAAKELAGHGMAL